MASRNDIALAVAVIGAGEMARQMIAVLVKLGRPVTAIYSRTPDKARKLVEEFGLSYTVVYDSLPNLWEHDDAHYVYIASPNYTHARYALDAMYHGRHVLVETAMVLCVRELADIERCIRSEKRIFMEANTVFFSPLMRRLARAISEDSQILKIGQVGVVDIKCCMSIRERRLSLGSTSTGGGAVGEVAAYPLAAAVSLIGNDIKLAFSDMKFDENSLDTSGFAYFIGDGNTRVCVKFSIIDALPNVLYLGGANGYVSVYEYPRTSIYRCAPRGGEPYMVDIMSDILAEYDLDGAVFNNFRDVSLAVQILEFEKAVAAGYERCYAEDMTCYVKSQTVVRIVGEMLAQAKNFNEHVQNSGSAGGGL